MSIMPKSKFLVGDMVVISDVIPLPDEHPKWMEGDMDRYRGSVYIIEKIIYSPDSLIGTNKDPYVYRMGGCLFSWRGDWLERPSLFKINDSLFEV